MHSPVVGKVFVLVMIFTSSWRETISLPHWQFVRLLEYCSSILPSTQFEEKGILFVDKHLLMYFCFRFSGRDSKCIKFVKASSLELSFNVRTCSQSVFTQSVHFITGSPMRVPHIKTKHSSFSIIPTVPSSFNEKNVICKIYNVCIALFYIKNSNCESLLKSPIIQGSR